MHRKCKRRICIKERPDKSAKNIADSDLIKIAQSLKRELKKYTVGKKQIHKAKVCDKPQAIVKDLRKALSKK